MIAPQLEHPSDIVVTTEKSQDLEEWTSLLRAHQVNSVQGMPVFGDISARMSFPDKQVKVSL